MLKTISEIKSFTDRLFYIKDVEINGVTASVADLVCLSMRLSRGEENIKCQKQYIEAGKIKRLCITTTN